MTLPAGGTPKDVRFRWHSAWGGAGGAYGAHGGGAVGILTPILAPPWVWKPPQATDFNVFATLTGLDTANTTPPAEFPASVFNVPGGNIAVIRSVSILANNLLVSSNLRWTLLVNSTPTTGWTQLTINPRAAGSVEVSWTPEETFIAIPEGSRISWVVQVLDGGTYQLSVSYHGWFYPATFGG